MRLSIENDLKFRLHDSRLFHQWIDLILKFYNNQVRCISQVNI